jgi:hypothetical protein
MRRHHQMAPAPTSHRLRSRHSPPRGQSTTRCHSPRRDRLGRRRLVIPRGAIHQRPAPPADPDGRPLAACDCPVPTHRHRSTPQCRPGARQPAVSPLWRRRATAGAERRSLPPRSDSAPGVRLSPRSWCRLRRYDPIRSDPILAQKRDPIRSAIRGDPIRSDPRSRDPIRSVDRAIREILLGLYGIFI